ncbi:MAG TPA: pantoate--beta-alanine ligase [Tepidisphaeraceae bacterium]|jgi:pantoate--beta-alanine ligase
MTVYRTIAEFRAARGRLGGVALVPTMGALHAGHRSLIDVAGALARHVAVSIFVNPTQFGPREDFTKYPRPLEADLAMCQDAGVEMVFLPEPAEMYRPGEALAAVDMPELTGTLEGRHRPGHFAGVCQVVAKLFNIVQPQFALFGRKDFQQLRVIEAMAQALDFPVQVVGCPTLREEDGLAMSSRNRYLSADERARALSISRALFNAQAEYDAGAQVTARLVATMQRTLLDVGKLGHVPLSIDYVAAVDPHTLKTAETFDRPVTCAIAARVGMTRLIDNHTVNPG